MVNPFKNYRDFIWSFETFFDNCETFNKSNDEINWDRYYDSMKEIRNIAHITKQELENHILTNNHDSNRLLIRIRDAILKLDKRRESLIKKYNLNPINQRRFFEITQEICEFSNWFDKEGYNDDIKRNEAKDLLQNEQIKSIINTNVNTSEFIKFQKLIAIITFILGLGILIVTAYGVCNNHPIRRHCNHYECHK